MYRNILVPVSLENKDKAALACDTARTLAAPEATITLLHVVEHMPAHVRQYLPKNFLIEARAGLQPELERLAAAVPGAKAVVVEGHAGRTILDYAEEKGSDCIVIASHRPAMEDYLLGSTAAQVVRHAACAVMVVR
ncbi:MAG: universal stress protein [Tropicimonas sp.]|uniref:universal stress protein n=1 Tax=Tropicimonas sp. TaxID=2067044 RepID=UPI003A842762